MRAARSRRRKKTSEAARREELIDKLEALHNLVIDADAFQSAFQTVYEDTAWPRDKDPKRRRALNRMSCFVSQLRIVLDDLLRESRAVVTLVVKRAR